ncbi:MAG: glutamine ABC transporter substrate-binding protein GlnH [Paraburkholderia sp.]
MLIAGKAAAAPELLVATDASNVPFEFRDGDHYSGFDIDLLAAIAKDLGVTFKLQAMDFNGILPALQTRQVDAAIASITIKPERQRVLDFSDPYYDSGFLLMVPIGSSIVDEKSLTGKTLAVKTGTAAVDYAKENLTETKLRLFPNIDNAYLEVATGRADAAFHDAPSILYYIRTTGKDKVKSVGNLVMAQQYGIAFPKGSPWREKFNSALIRIRSGGEYNSIYKKWFGNPVLK